MVRRWGLLFFFVLLFITSIFIFIVVFFFFAILSIFTGLPVKGRPRSRAQIIDAQLRELKNKIKC